ncbi:MAG: YggT family protein [Acidimicrobiales bacterium]
MLGLLCYVVQIYTFVVLARIVLSWFPTTPGTALASIHQVLFQVTEPVLGPLRRLIPPIAMIDVSPIVFFLGVQVLVLPFLC